MKKIFSIFFITIIFLSCKKDSEKKVIVPNMDTIVYNPIAVNPDIPDDWPELNISPNNPLTKDGVQLGRMLFYDPILSNDSTKSCASCHKQELSFADNVAFSLGVNNAVGIRNSMALVNLGFDTHFNWDGVAHNLTEHAIRPLESPIELDLMWQEAERRLQNHAEYQKWFKKAFNISNVNEINRDLVTKAIEQFELTMISKDARIDKAIRGEVQLTASEERGYFLYQATVGADNIGCRECHGLKPLFGLNVFRNNGLTLTDELSGFPDAGRGAITGNPADTGKFKTPSLRNIALSAPYMHDGRFNTLDEVMNHYIDGGHFSPTLDENIRPLLLNAIEKQSVIDFLHTLTDTTFINNPDFSNPFE